MNQLFQKLRGFFADHVHRSAVLLCGCTLLAVSAGVGSAFLFSKPAVPAVDMQEPAPSVSLTVSSSATSFPSSASVTETSSATSLADSIAEEKEPIQLTLVAESYTQDLNVNIVDETGALVRDVMFQLRVTGLDKSNDDYDKPFDIDLKDGNLYLSWIPEGKYRISMREEEGFITPAPIEITVEKYVVVYEKIEDITDQIVDEKDINVSEDDNAYGGGGGAGNDGSADTNTPPPTTTDTIAFVESSTKTVTEELKDANGNKLYTYTYEVGPNGFLLNVDGTESDVEPVFLNDALSHGIRYIKVGSTADTSAVQTVAYTVIESVRFALQPLILFNETGTDPSDSVSSDSNSSDSVTSDPGSSASVSSETSSSDSASTETDTPPSSSVPESSSSVESNSDSAGDSSVPETFTVRFLNPDGTVLHTTTVTAGGTADAPASPVFTDNSGKIYRFTGWSSDYTNIRQALDITAVYDIFTTENVALFNADNTPVSAYKITATVRTENKTVYTGWQTINGKTYYYTADHKKVTGWQVIQSISYFFNADGVRSDCMGIDVSRWNGTIDWNKVKAAGIDFAIIRVGYRGYGTGQLVKDHFAIENLKGATAAGLKIGVYVFSQAINLEEAVEEASMALEMVKGYKLDYPIFIDSEYSTSAKDGRADHISTALRTAICDAFCKTVANSGYRTGIYASKSWFQYQLNVAELEKYHIWVAHYTTATDYARRYDMWQYTASATVPGISGSVDMNFSYLNY